MRAGKSWGWLGCGIVIGAASWGIGVAAPPPAAKPATAPASAPATPAAAAHPFRDNVKVEVTDQYFIVRSNGIPDHDIGPFPSAHNPNTIREQRYVFKI